MKAHRNHKKFLMLVGSPKALTVQEFASPLQCHDETILPKLPGASAAATDASHNTDEIKHMVFNAMPVTWMDDCKMTFDLQNADLNSLVHCMERQDRISKSNNDDKCDNANEDCRNQSAFTAAIKSNLIPQLDLLHQSCQQTVALKRVRFGRDR